MTVFVYKENGLYKALSEDGFIINVWQFRSDKSARELIPVWMLKSQYETEFIKEYWKDSRFQMAVKLYEENYKGVTFRGEAV